jgi:hypothetical protein
MNFYRKSFALQSYFSTMGKNGKGGKMGAPLCKQAVKIDKDHTKSIAKENKLKRCCNHHQMAITDNPNKVTVPRVFAEKRVKAQAQWMVNMMEMINNVVDKQGWFGSTQMDQESDLTATLMHQQQQQRLFDGNILNIGHLMLNNKELYA